ncbi:hypothetical protein DN752_04765 [Echinicola strongylocentroti]|uniref:DUF7793 domain-containing protein n=1 Tax=Echinicola strongylocentroti TaxID=1795355 RepID=A0A2Z4IFM8_9BACT|nr:hypothetical protein [Echinicola strongylocentroti]AWW29500.1 hypothetical protein DN752_04765 [Echinicola strongylocentroti]
MNSTTTATQELTLLNNGIIYCKVLPNKFLELNDGKENLKAVSELSQGKPAAVLIDISRATGISKECRDLFASTQCADIQYAVGIVAQTVYSNLIGSFFLGFNKPLFPVRMFTEHSIAIEWLKTIEDDE